MLYNFMDSPKDLYEMVREVSHEWKGLSIDRIKKSPTGVTWPSESLTEPDTRSGMYPDNRFLTEDGKVQLDVPGLGSIKWTEPTGSPNTKKGKGFPLIFTQGKVVQHWQQTHTNWSQFMGQFSRGNFVTVHPETAAGLGLKDGDEVYIETEIGSLRARLSLTNGILPGVIWTASHPAPSSPIKGNAGACVNMIVPFYWDKVSAQYNGFKCRLIKA